LNEPQDITGKACGENGQTMPTAGSKFFDVVKPDTNTDGSEQLFFGDSSTGDGSAVEKRPTALDQANPYHKV
jgi:hypothetical protein